MNTVIIQKAKNCWLSYSNPVDIVYSRALPEVYPAFLAIQDHVDSGRYAAGYIAYEAAPAFDPALEVHEPGDLPLLWFGIYDSCEEIDELPSMDGAYNVGEWQPDLSEEAYLRKIDRIREYIKAGDTYQVNYTIRQSAEFEGSPETYFADLCRAQRSRNCAFINTEEFAVCSASPELFIARKGRAVKSCPMKGTSPRGMTVDEDDRLASELHESEKNRAENVMIVDMIRNDLGRVSDPGTVRAEDCFAVEKYPTVLQMTSTVRGESDASLLDIMKAMFPCSSITGAPKVRTMQIIKELESGPRGVYTGAIGCIAPGETQKALFNVAIRTVTINKQTGRAEYGVGGGIVWDSDAGGEYRECLAKAGVLTERQPEFSLLETMLWSEEGGYYLLDEHIERLKCSARYFCYPLNEDDLMEKLIELSSSFGSSRQRVRLLLDERGNVTLQNTALAAEGGAEPLRLAMAAAPVSSKNRFLYHKTTHRTVYEEARAAFERVDDVVLYNEKGEVTEATIANIIAEIDGKKLTPPVGCGLLAGTLRAHLLKTGEIEEGVITVDDLKRADKIYIINSVRGMVSAEIRG